MYHCLIVVHAVHNEEIYKQTKIYVTESKEHNPKMHVGL